MDILEIQVLLKDGSFTDYEVHNDKDKYVVMADKKEVISYIAKEDGRWEVEQNFADIDSDMQERIINQLNGYRL